MKKNFLTASIVLLLITAERAGAWQQHKFEFSLGYGLASSDYLFDGYSLNFPAPALHNYNYRSYSGAISGALNYAVSNRISLGISFAYEHAAGDWFWNFNAGGHDDDWYKVNIGTFRRTAITIAPEIIFQYNKAYNGIYRVYSRLGAGFTAQNEVGHYSISPDSIQYSGMSGQAKYSNADKPSTTRTHINGHYTPFGIRVGRKVAGFAELGIGYRGLVSCGL